MTLNYHCFTCCHRHPHKRQRCDANLGKSGSQCDREIGVTWPKAREHLGPAESGRGMEEFSPKESPFGRSVALLFALISDSWSLEPKQMNFCCI